MTIDAIHRAMFALIQLLLRRLRIAGNVLCRFSLIVGVVHDRDRLPLGIGGDVSNPRVIGQVNTNRTLPRPSAYFQK